MCNYLYNKQLQHNPDRLHMLTQLTIKILFLCEFNTTLFYTVVIPQHLTLVYIIYIEIVVSLQCGKAVTRPTHSTQY